MAHAAPAGAQEAEPGAAPPELFRLRITNRVGGPVEVSADGGSIWEPLGQVTRPASESAAAPAVLGVAAPGSVAGVAPNQVAIRVPGVRGALRQLVIAAKGGPAGASAIGTDIAARAGPFRPLAPALGSRVRLERGGRLAAMPDGYAPRAGDRLVILQTAPAWVNASVTLENRAGGDVVLVDAGALRPIGRVKQPLRGFGRYAGTERAGGGSVLAWTPTTLLVASAGTGRRTDPDGNPAEERGGFVIQPAEPALKGATHPDSQVLVEALPGESGARVAGCRLFGLAGVVSSGDPLDPTPTRVEVRIDEGEWEPVPDIRGAVSAAEVLKVLQEALGTERPVKSGITHLRVVFGIPTRQSVDRLLRLATTPLEPAPQRGEVVITASVMGEGISFVSFLLNGVQATLTNVAPYTWKWDTRRVANGEHLIEIRGLDARGALVSTVSTRVLVDN